MRRGDHADRRPGCMTGPFPRRASEWGKVEDVSERVWLLHDFCRWPDITESFEAIVTA